MDFQTHGPGLAQIHLNHMNGTSFFFPSPNFLGSTKRNFLAQKYENNPKSCGGLEKKCRFIRNYSPFFLKTTQKVAETLSFSDPIKIKNRPTHTYPTYP
jgi:hypothetical protein